MKKNISYIVFVFLFLDLLYIKAYFYGLVAINSYLSSLANLIPEKISFFLFVPIYDLFFLPINWLLFNLFGLNELHNVYLNFSLDILLTTILLVIIFNFIKKLIKNIINNKKKSEKNRKKIRRSHS